MERYEALALLNEVQRVRRRTKTEVGGLWFPLVVFGALSVLSAPLYGPALGVYWMVASPIGIALTVGFYCRRERAVGAESRVRPIVSAMGMIVVGTAVTGSLGGALGAERIAAIGPTLAVAAGLLMFARIEHSEPLAVLAAGMVTAAVALAIFGVAPAAAATALAAGTGTASLLLGLAMRIRGGS